MQRYGTLRDWLATEVAVWLDSILLGYGRKYNSLVFYNFSVHGFWPTIVLLFDIREKQRSIETKYNYELNSINPAPQNCSKTKQCV